MLRNVADGVQCRATNLESTFSDIVGHREDLFGVFIEQEVVIAKMAASHVPVEVLGFQIEREHIGKQRSQLFRYFSDGIAAKAARVFGDVLWFRFCLNCSCAALRHGLSILSELPSKCTYWMLRVPGRGTLRVFFHQQDATR